MKSQRFFQHGFTLIELMMVVAIMGVLATMAMPSYQDRVVRAQIKEGLNLADFSQAGIQSYFRAHQRLPNNNADAGLPPPDKIVGNYVTRVEVKDGASHLSFGNNANRLLVGKTLTVRPAVVKGYPQVPIAWVCGQAGVPGQMEVMGENKTDLPLELLPVDCRPGPSAAPKS